MNSNYEPIDWSPARRTIRAVEVELGQFRIESLDVDQNELETLYVLEGFREKRQLMERKTLEAFRKVFNFRSVEYSRSPGLKPVVNLF